MTNAIRCVAIATLFLLASCTNPVGNVYDDDPPMSRDTEEVEDCSGPTHVEVNGVRAYYLPAECNDRDTLGPLR